CAAAVAATSRRASDLTAGRLRAGWPAASPPKSLLPEQYQKLDQRIAPDLPNVSPELTAGLVTDARLIEHRCSSFIRSLLVGIVFPHGVVDHWDLAVEFGCVRYRGVRIRKDRGQTNAERSQRAEQIRTAKAGVKCLGPPA